LINGSPSKEFKVSCGIRQGDPLSPLLFDTAVKGLSVLFQRVQLLDFSMVFRCEIENVSLICSGTLVFMPVSLQSLQAVKQILRWFELCSELKINFHKSLVVGINLDEPHITGIDHSAIGKHDSIWKGKMLSMTGRICMIKSVLALLPLNFMFISLMSKGVYNILTAIQRRSLSAGVAQQMKICKVQWKAVIKEKQKEDWVLALYWVRIRHCFLSGYKGYVVQLKTNGKRL